MKNTYLLYLALAQRDRPTSPARARCCTDVPESLTHAPSVGGRWVRKLALAVPASFAAFRGTLGNPLPTTEVSPGDAVVTPSGATIGRVRDVYLGRVSGEATIAIEPAASAASGTVLMLPQHAVRTRRAGSVVLDVTTSRKVA
jgi:hypothetical protein